VLARQSERVLLLADASKLDQTSAVRIAGLDIVDTLITDDRVEAGVIDRFESAGVEVRVAR